MSEERRPVFSKFKLLRHRLPKPCNVQERWVCEVKPGYFYYWAECGSSRQTGSPDLAYSWASREEAESVCSREPGWKPRRLKIYTCLEE